MANDHFASDDLIRHAGLVVAQAANIAAALETGELICPFAVVAKGDSRESIAFEAPTQDAAIGEGWASLENYKEYFDLWAFAREGLMRGPNGKEDVLVVAAWTHGMGEPSDGPAPTRVSTTACARRLKLADLHWSSHVALFTNHSCRSSRRFDSVPLLR